MKSVWTSPGIHALGHSPGACTLQNLAYQMLGERFGTSPTRSFFSPEAPLLAR
ncbi:MAG: hypothetical protein OXN25_14980 [Candidatus Poribacteria bacterium]|nr:hypothetical protein [Candidatus Poribacteria bacterium]